MSTPTLCQHICGSRLPIPLINTISRLGGDIILHWCQHQLGVNTSVEAYSQYLLINTISRLGGDIVLHWCQQRLCVNTSVEADSQYFYLIPFLVLVSTLSPGAYSRFYLIPFHLPTTISQGAYSQLLHNKKFRFISILHCFHINVSFSIYTD